MTNLDRAKEYAESFNRSGLIKSCPYCKTGKLYVVNAVDNDIGYIVICNCRKIGAPRWEDYPEKAIASWNEEVDKNHPLSEIMKLVKYLSNDDLKQLTAELTLMSK